MTEAHAVKYKTLASPNTQDSESASLPYPKTNSDIPPELTALLEGQYVVEERIGKGAQSHVYRGIRLSDNMPVAIKQLRVNSAKDWKQYELFEREAEVLKNLNVPGTAKFYEAIKALDGETPTSVIVQEYIEGRTLQSYIDQQTRFSFEVICNILVQILNILQNLHSQTPPVIHRDIKPSNIILRYDDDKYAQTPEVFIIDFGAVANPQVKDGGSTVTGTYGYMAPEQLIGQPTTASDLYSFGILAVYLFSGVPPEKLETKDLQLLIDPHLEHLPYAVTMFLRQLIEPSPLKRLVNYEAIQETLYLFKNEQFKLSPDICKYTPQDPLIDNIQTLGQKGNITLWQNLPDQTPRKIPQIYKDMIEKDKLFWPVKNLNIAYNNYQTYQESKYAEVEWLKIVREQLRNPLFKKIAFDICGNSSPESNRRVIKFVMLSLLVYLAAAALFIASGLDVWNIPVALSVSIFSTLMFVALYICLFPFIETAKWNKTQPFSYQLPFNCACPKAKQEQFKEGLSHIFTHGRKSLSTISNIEFITPEHQKPTPITMPSKLIGNDHFELEWQLLMKASNFQHEKQREKLRPLWKIEYYFNPPDDNNPNPVHHVYYSEVPPVDLKIGDTLPILYYIKNNVVYSIPYPLPTHSSLALCPNLMADLDVNITV